MESAQFAPRTLSLPISIPFVTNPRSLQSNARNLPNSFLHPLYSVAMSPSPSTESNFSNASSARTTVGSSTSPKRRKIVVSIPKNDERKPMLNGMEHSYEPIGHLHDPGSSSVDVRSREVHFDENRLGHLPPLIDIFLSDQSAWDDYYYDSDEDTPPEFPPQWQMSYQSTNQPSMDSSLRTSRRNSGFSSTLPPRLQRAYDSRYQTPDFAALLSKSLGVVKNWDGNPSQEMVRGRSMNLLEFSRGFDVEEMSTVVQALKVEDVPLPKTEEFESEEENIVAVSQIIESPARGALTPGFTFPPRSTPSSSPLTIQGDFLPPVRQKALSATAADFVYVPTPPTKITTRRPGQFRFPSQSESMLGNTEESDESDMESFDGSEEEDVEEEEVEEEEEKKEEEEELVPNILVTPRRKSTLPATVTSTPSELSVDSPYSIRQATTISRSFSGLTRVDDSSDAFTDGSAARLITTIDATPRPVTAINAVEEVARIAEFLENQLESLNASLSEKINLESEKVEEMMEVKMKGMEERLSQRIDNIQLRSSYQESIEADPIQAEIYHLEMKYLKLENERLCDLVNSRAPSIPKSAFPPTYEFKYPSLSLPSPPSSPDTTRESTQHYYRKSSSLRTQKRSIEWNSRITPRLEKDENGWYQ